MNSKLDTIAKPPPYHCLVLTLSAIDRKMPPKMVPPSNGTKEGHGEESVHDVFCFFVKNGVRIGGALFVWCTCA